MRRCDLVDIWSSKLVIQHSAPGRSGTLRPERCRHLFPSLRILSGLEMGEPHWHHAAAADVLGAGRFDPVLGPLRCLPDGDGFSEPPGLYRHRPAAEVIRQRLGAILVAVDPGSVEHCGQAGGGVVVWSWRTRYGIVRR